MDFSNYASDNLLYGPVRNVLFLLNLALSETYMAICNCIFYKIVQDIYIGTLHCPSPRTGPTLGNSSTVQNIYKVVYHEISRLPSSSGHSYVKNELLQTVHCYSPGMFVQLTCL